VGTRGGVRRGACGEAGGSIANQTIFLSDVAEALEITAKLTDAVAGEVTREWDTAARAYVQRLD
jgi:hypothetical protein